MIRLDQLPDPSDQVYHYQRILREGVIAGIRNDSTRVHLKVVDDTNTRAQWPMAPTEATKLYGKRHGMGKQGN